LKSFKLSLFAFTLLLSPSVASSFVPFAGCLKNAQRASLLGVSSKYRMRGGADSHPAGSPVPHQTPVGQGNEVLGDETSSEHADKSLNEAGSQPPADVGSQSMAAVEPGEKALLGPKAASPGAIRKTVPGFPWHKLPNWLTYIRCLAIPAVVALFYLPNRHVETGCLFAVASFTDWLDGYLARRWDITSPFGAFLDPVADKLMVSTALILLSGRFGMHVVIPTCIILARELSVSALREWMAQRGLRDLVKVGLPENGLGLLAEIEVPAKILLYLCAGITVTSGSVYFRAAAPALLKAD
jgi:CDP-diacylglycerol--glycerol-3-phosphate 3-phosphatidyltransferase